MIFHDPAKRAGPGAASAAGGGLSAVADLLLSGPAGPATDTAEAAPPEATRATRCPARAETDRAQGGAPVEGPVLEAAPPRGVYVLVPAGVAPSARRDAALAAAGRLAARDRPAGVLLFEAGRVDAHVLGDTGTGRLGPQNYLGAADVGQTVRRLADHCDPIALVPLDAPDGLLDRAAGAVERPVFLVDADAESLVEAYRTLKTWRQWGAGGRSAVLFAGRAAAEARPLHARLRQAARAFLGCDLARQRTPNGEGLPAGSEAATGVRLFAGAPAEAVWGPLLGAQTDPPATVEPRAAAPEAAGAGASRTPTREAAPPAVRPAFMLWQPESRDDLLDALAAQLPALLGEAYPHVFRVDVAEPGAPPLVAVRSDGALVAVLFGEADEIVPTAPARQWLRVHWPLLVRVWPGAGLGEAPQVDTMVLAAAGRTPSRRSGGSGGGVRPFVPVRLGGHTGIVLLG